MGLPNLVLSCVVLAIALSGMIAVRLIGRRSAVSQHAMIAADLYILVLCMIAIGVVGAAEFVPA